MDILENLKEKKIIAIVRGVPGEQIIRTARALYNGGIRFMEVTFDQTSPTKLTDTPAAIRAVMDELPDMYVGAGTVMTTEQAERIHEVGGRYIISPDCNVSVIRRTKELGMLSLPGALTPTEIAVAHEAGADFVKVFPAGVLGAAYIKAIKAPLKHIPLLAVGSVSEKNLAELYRAGVCGFGIGGNLVDSKVIAAGAFDTITETAKRYVDLVSSLN